MTDCSQNNTRRRFFQLRSAESRYLPISRWLPPRSLVIPGSPKPECDPTGRFPRPWERAPGAPRQLSGLLTASFRSEPAPRPGALRRGPGDGAEARGGPRDAPGRGLGEGFPGSWRADVEREGTGLGLPPSRCGQKGRFLCFAFF